jgi:hypothetical protein
MVAVVAEGQVVSAYPELIILVILENIRGELEH